LLILLPLLTAMWPSGLRAQDEGHIGMPTDWSHRHMVFSAPRSRREALHLSENPRYLQQWLRRNIERRPRRHRLHSDLNADWSASMGAGATVGAGQYPAKFSFSATTDSCANDFVVFNTSLAGATGQASIIAYNNLYVGCPGTSPSVYWAYDTGGTISTSVTFSLDVQPIGVRANAGWGCDAGVAEMESFRHPDRRSADGSHQHRGGELSRLQRTMHDDHPFSGYRRPGSHPDRFGFRAVL
jgi:hypothetical protein